MLTLNAVRGAVGAVAWAATKVSPLEKRFKIRNRLTGPFPEGPFLWLHGASLGECKMLVSLFGLLKSDCPSLPRVLITTQKTEVFEYLRPVAEREGFAVSLAPLDTPNGIRNFIEAVKPQLLVLAENELWPGYLAAMRKMNIRPSVALVSGRFYHCLDADEFRAIGFVSMQTGADLTRFVAAGDYSVPAKTIIGGDWKLLAWARSQKDVVPPEAPSVDTAFLSFHIQEWRSLSAMLLQAMDAKESVVLAPRFLTEIPEMERLLVELEIPVVEWPLVRKGAVSVVSSYGKLQDVLAVSKSSVIGGSFVRNLGVHDFWESLKMGVSTCIGPYSRGQKSSVEALLREGAIAQIPSADAYRTRSAPDPEAVSRFLSHEREKVNSSYDAFLKFLQSTIESK